MTLSWYKSSGSGPVDSDTISALNARDAAAMGRMADDWRTAPEVLFVLSQAPSAAIRAKVAANRSTPEIADQLLLNDSVAAVRAELGRRIAASLPELAGPELERLRDIAAAKLLVLARDVDTEVRRALSAAVARLDCVPKDVITILARDLDEMVSVPVVEFSPLLDEEDLVALITEPPSALALAAVARRNQLTPAVVDRLIDAGDIASLTALAGNATIQMRESALDRLVECAASVDVLHSPLAARHDLTDRLVAKLTQFVSTELIAQLARRHGLGAETRRALRAKIDGPQHATADQGPDEADILNAAGRNAAGPVIAALAERAGISEDSVRRVFAMRMAKAIVALSWKAGLSMRTAFTLQAFPGRVPQSRRLSPTPDGRYPLGEEELEWHLSSLGIGPGTVSPA